jgi:hypothetical protein
MSEEEREFLNNYVIGKWKISDDGISIDVDGDVNMCRKDLHRIISKFNKINGKFVCSDNHLLSLDGAPKQTSSDFSCSGNKLDSIELRDLIVGRDLDVSYNNITSLEGLPKEVKGIIWIHDCPIVSINGIQDMKFKDIRFNFRNKGCISKESLNILIKVNKEYKKYPYIVTVMLSLLEITNKEDIEKMVNDIRPEYNNGLMDDVISDLIIEKYSISSKCITEFAKQLSENIDSLYKKIDKKIGGSLDLKRDLLDLGF